MERSTDEEEEEEEQMKSLSQRKQMFLVLTEQVYVRSYHRWMQSSTGVMGVGTAVVRTCRDRC